MSAAIGGRTLIQGLLFLIVARVLGVRDYGAYAAVLALGASIGSFGGMGVNVVMLREVSRQPSCFSSAWGATLVALAVTTPLLFMVYLVLAGVLIPLTVPVGATIFVGLAEIILTPLILVSVHAYQSQGQIEKAAWIYLLPVLPRFVGALALIPVAVILPESYHLMAWTALYLVATLITADLSRRLVRRAFGRADIPGFSRIWAKLKLGFPFAVGTAALKLYTDIDKTMLARLSTLEATGAYSASYRIVDLATIPGVAMTIAAAPRLFREGEKGIVHAMAFAKRILLMPMVLTISASIAIYWGAELFPWLLGADYEAAVPALRWLAWLPCISVLRLFLQTLLISSDQHNQAVSVLLFGAIVNIALNWWLIPEWGWRGAVLATYGAELIMICVMMLAAVWAKGRHRI